MSVFLDSLCLESETPAKLGELACPGVGVSTKGSCPVPCFDTLPRLKLVGFWIQAEIAIVANGLTSPSPRVDAPTLNIL